MHAGETMHCKPCYNISQLIFTSVIHVTPGNHINIHFERNLKMAVHSTSILDFGLMQMIKIQIQEYFHQANDMTMRSR